MHVLYFNVCVDVDFWAALSCFVTVIYRETDPFTDSIMTG